MNCYYGARGAVKIQEKYYKPVNVDVNNAGFEILCKCFMRHEIYLTQYIIVNNTEFTEKKVAFNCLQDKRHRSPFK